MSVVPLVVRRHEPDIRARGLEEQENSSRDKIGKMRGNILFWRDEFVEVRTGGSWIHRVGSDKKQGGLWNANPGITVKSDQ